MENGHTKLSTCYKSSKKKRVNSHLNKYGSEW